MVKMTPTGTIIPTVLALSAGTKMKRISIRIMGATASFGCFEMKTVPCLDVIDAAKNVLEGLK